MHRKHSQVEQKVTSVKSGKHVTILEHPCDELLLTVDSGKDKRKMQAYVTKDISAPPQFSLLLKSVLDLPSEKGMPLRIVQAQPDGKRSRYTIRPAWQILPSLTPPSSCLRV